MKNQYFGDINDFRKYGLIRALQDGNRLRLLAVWMLTKDDFGSDGKKRKYLKDPKKKWRTFDEELFDFLKKNPPPKKDPKVEYLERSKLLPNTTYFKDEVPKLKVERIEWRDRLKTKAKGKDLVFFDPDNGIEPPKGRLTEKHLAWEEIKMIWDGGSSILTYQHFGRKDRCEFKKELVADLKRLTGSKYIKHFSTPDTLFLLVGQHKHEVAFEKAIESNLTKWKEAEEIKIK